MTKAKEIWQNELCDDPDSVYILHGITNGFKIVDVDCFPENVYCSNYKSTGVHAELVESQIQKEIDEGNYVMCDTKPNVVSSLGAILKPDGKSVRLIHDLSRGV